MKKLEWLKTRYGYWGHNAEGHILAHVFNEEGGYSVSAGMLDLGFYADVKDAFAAAEEALSLPQQLELFETKQACPL